MAGSIKSAPEQLLRILLMVFLLWMATPRCSMTCDGGRYVPLRDRAVFVCTTLAAALVLWLAQGAADVGGGRLLRGLLLLGVGLSVASCSLCLEPVVGYTVAVYRLGCDGSVVLAAAGVAGVAGAATVYVMFAAEALFDRVTVN